MRRTITAEEISVDKITSATKSLFGRSDSTGSIKIYLTMSLVKVTRSVLQTMSTRLSVSGRAPIRNTFGRTERRTVSSHATYMSEKHLSKGSTCPPLQPGKLRLYNMRFCPYAQRTCLVLAAKKLPFDIVNVNLKEKPEWLFEKNPLGKVPALEIDGEVLYESLILSDFLEERFPNLPLYPTDPVKKAKDKILIQLFQQVIDSMYKVMKGIDVETMVARIKSGLDQFEIELKRRGTSYYGGSSPGMVDYMIWPWFERAHLPSALSGGDLTVPKDRYPNLVAWMAAMEKDEPVKRFYLSTDIHLRFMGSLLSGNPNYDIPVPSAL